MARLVRRLWPGGSSVAAAFVTLAALILAACSYAPGFGGTFHFDDYPNLESLSGVTDAATAIKFVTDGSAGPLGRPLALASFLPQAYAWPNSPQAFLYINVGIHLFNGILVIWVLNLLGRAHGYEPKRAAWISTMSGAIWLLLPILASTTLLVIQRMTSLSATFMLLGLIAYLSSRRLYTRAPRTGLVLMTCSLLLGTSLSVLCKENGALLPVLVLVVEATLLRPPFLGERRLWKAWSGAVLGVPTVLLLGYLAFTLDYSERIQLMRGFSAPDRVLTQAHILWEYLHNAFLPHQSRLGPFHDDHPLHLDWLSLSSLLAVGSWLVVIACSVIYRTHAPLFSFAVGWYLVGHSLESTTVPLELYFEHRNYIPLIGPVFALVASLSTPRLPQAVVRAGLAAYGLTLAAVLASTSSLWGTPALAAEMWYREHPSSIRAVQYLAQQLQNEGDLVGVRHILSRHFERHPTYISSELQALRFSCILEPSVPHAHRLEAIKANLPDAKFEYTVFPALRDLYHTTQHNPCGSIDSSTVYELIKQVAAHPVFSAVPLMRHNLNILMSEEAFARRDLALTMHHIETALEAHSTFASLNYAVSMLTSAGLFSTALDFVQNAYEQVPSHPVRALRWRKQLSSLEVAIRSAQNADESSTNQRKP